jgi:protein-disulfide isomerase
MDAFNACVESKQFQAQVVSDYQTGTQLGVTGTPAFFINGRFVSGAQPFELFKYIIDDELAR